MKRIQQKTKPKKMAKGTQTVATKNNFYSFIATAKSRTESFHLFQPSVQNFHFAVRRCNLFFFFSSSIAPVPPSFLCPFRVAVALPTFARSSCLIFIFNRTESECTRLANQLPPTQGFGLHFSFGFEIGRAPFFPDLSLSPLFSLSSS